MRLYIKGTETQARAALEARGVKNYDVLKGDSCPVVVTADINHEATVKWFVEDVDGPPYAPGSLLFYMEESQPNPRAT